ncbi:SPT2 chromatin protein [Euphorbia peplus]|nr:SPT2 chromatin protein [Euphorbia peplus]
MQKGLLSKTTLGNVESKAKVQQRKKSEPKPKYVKVGVKQEEVTALKLADVKKIKALDQKQPSYRNFEKRPSADVKKIKLVDQKQPLCHNSEKRPSSDLRKIKPVDQKQPSCWNSEKRPSTVKKGVDQKQPPSCRNPENRPSTDVRKGVDQKQPSPCRNSKKRPLEVEDEKAFNILRRMLNMQRFAGRDDSDRLMEASFGDIMKEEKRSERLARKEDAEQLRLLKKRRSVDRWRRGVDNERD